MAANNCVVLIGRAGNSVKEDAKTVGNGEMVATVRLAVNRPTKDSQGNPVTDWVNCEGWGKNAERMAEFIQKGDLISVSGALRIETWEKEGQKHSKTLVRVENFQMLESRASREQRQGDGGQANAGSRQAYQGGGQQKPASKPAAKQGDYSDDFAFADDDGLPPF